MSEEGKALVISLGSKPREPEKKVDEREEALEAAGGALVGAIKGGDGKTVGKILRDILSITKE